MPKKNKTHTIRNVIIITIVVVCLGLILGIYFRIQKVKNTPIPIFIILSDIGIVDMNLGYDLNLSVTDATLVTVNEKEVIGSGNIYKTNIPLLHSGNVLKIVAQNKYKSTWYNLVLQTKQEIQEQERIQKELALQQQKKENRIKYLKNKMNITYDEFQKINRIKNKQPRYINTNFIRFYFGKTDGGQLAPRFAIVYAGDDWLFINEYIFLIDGEIYNYTPSVEVKRDNNSSVWERIDVPMEEETRNFIQKIISGKVVKIKCVGSEGEDTRIITEKEKITMKETLELYDLLSN